MRICALVLLSILPGAVKPPQDDETQKSVVMVIASLSPPNPLRPWESTAASKVTGSGVVIEGKKILTNAHVILYAQEIYVQPNKSSDRINATVEFWSRECDLAVLKLEDPGELKPLAFADSLPKLKSKISVLGFPAGGDTLSVTEGVVSRIEFNSSSGPSGLRIQVDAAINPGNSGGPGIIDGKIAGIVESRLREADKIGYLIPREVVARFLETGYAGKKNGFPRVELEAAPLENPALRRYLKLEKKDTGVVLHRIDLPDLAEKLRPWDVIMECESVAIDNLGMVPIDQGIRVGWEYLVSRKTPGSAVKLKILRDGKALEVEVPTVTENNFVVQALDGVRPSYFTYGGLVFTRVTRDLIAQAGSGYLARLAIGDRILPRHLMKRKKSPDEDLAATCALLPHKLTKGYNHNPLSVVTHVNDQPVKNLRHLITLIKENKEKEFIIFRFENDAEEKIVLDPKEVEKFSSEILRNNNIPSACSDDLKDLWP